MLRIRIRMDPLHFGQSDQGSKKSAKIMENFNKNPQKLLEYHTYTDFNHLLLKASITNSITKFMDKFIFTAST